MMLGISILIVLIMVGVTGVISDKARETVMTESLDKGRAIAQNLSMIAEEAILTSDDISLFLPFNRLEWNVQITHRFSFIDFMLLQTI